jgi:phosphoglycolate phosphatase
MPLIVFDLDGTLIDSQRDIADAANALILERGGQPLPVERIAEMVGDGAAVLLRRALATAGLRDDVRSALARFLELYDERLLRTTRLYEGIDDAVAELAQSAPLAVLTNKPTRPTERILDGLGIANRFRWIVGGDGPFARKPDPASLRHLMADAAATADRTIMIGDSAIDLATARAAGTHVCLARYGFGFRLAPTDLRGDERLADRPADIPPLVRAILS